MWDNNIICIKQCFCKQPNQTIFFDVWVKFFEDKKIYYFIQNKKKKIWQIPTIYGYFYFETSDYYQHALTQNIVY